mmetsp:Transcript_26656/g.65339  ORF Transcript_26656/g.65339 Transcript_26656/m.65339 type:complete len:148 (+) Transcript_26656:181-624(+)|eukprot:CAMPEP_0197601512 /NCGR_PEP_ID=MMETSP1326-20131121/35438_1 /TAXON_ID=1155430 /ORGANISM="Genus nov. species nov., Strain RCC2288" /LENGTH=147 /DNA_ID=CAMNT_0043168749 /DNA_START=180 /DNA_END=623 /DNA_ORIENTATION=-
MAALLRIASEASTSSGSRGLFSALLTKTIGSTRSFHGTPAAWAAATKKKGKGDGPTADTGMSATHCTGLNFIKGGVDPELGPDSAYPDWLWALIEPKKTLLVLEKEVAIARLTGDTKAMDIKDIKRLLKLRRRVLIKKNNDSKSKGN